MKNDLDMIEHMLPLIQDMMVVKQDDIAISLPLEYGSRLRTHIHEIREQWAKDGHKHQDIEDASYALIALVDESIMLSTWPGRDRWAADLLQVEYFQEHLAGVGFYEKANNLMHAPQRPVSVLAVYQVCIYLGFKGRYLFESQEVCIVFKQELNSCLIHDLNIEGEILLC